jgi:TRAP-type transport system periplasmic protein
MKSVRTFLYLVLAMAICLTSFQALAAEKVVTIKAANFLPVGHGLSVIVDQWGKDVEKRSQGRVKFSYYPAGTLVGPMLQYESVVKGIIDVGNHVIGYSQGRFPLTELLNMPFSYPNATIIGKLANDYYKKFKPKEFDDVKVLFFHCQGPGILHTKTRLVMKLEDLNGLKIRTFGSNAEFMKLLGGTPVAMPMTEAYDALSRGVADGILASYESLKTFRTGEVVKYTTENFGSAYTSVFVVAMNKEKWSSLPPDIQTIIDQLNQEYVEKSCKAWEDIEKEGKEFVVARGNKIYTLPKDEDARWAAKAKVVIDEYVKGIKAKGLPGDEGLKFIRDNLAQR